MYLERKKGEGERKEERNTGEELGIQIKLNIFSD